LIFKHCII